VFFLHLRRLLSDFSELFLEPRALFAFDIDLFIQLCDLDVFELDRVLDLLLDLSDFVGLKGAEGFAHLHLLLLQLILVDHDLALQTDVLLLLQGQCLCKLALQKLAH
jgi:hypothetical protein